MISEQKQRLRETIRAHLSAWDAARRSAASALIRQQLVSLKEWREAEVIALFHPLSSEPNCLAEDWKGKTYCLPRVEGEELVFHAVAAKEELKPGALRIYEPDPERHPVIEGKEISLVVVPGVAFEAAGHRMGRGKGFYDRALSGPLAKAFKVGVCFSCQIVGNIPSEPHDIKVDRVIFA